ncbi:MAG: hypothetical protein AB7O73_07630 [Bacteroidia bacterium]
MKKSDLLLCICLLITITLHSQSKSNKKNSRSGSTANTYEKGETDVNIGLGFVNNGYYYGQGYHRASLPIAFSLDHGVTENISIGGYFAWSRVVYKYYGKWNNGNGWYDYTDTYSWSYYVLGVRAAYHLGPLLEVENFDLYPGIAAGYNLAKYKRTTTDPNSSRTFTIEDRSRPFLGVYVGARYLFTDNLGVFGEFGYGLSYATIGLNIKL